MESKETDLVAKDNTLVEASFRLDLVEQRLILAAIVEARESDTGLGAGHITIEAKQFAATFGMEEGSVYGQLKQALKSLFRRYVVIHDMDPQSGMPRVSELRWLSRASYIDGAGAVQFRFATDIVPYISRLAEGEFTRYKLERISKLTSSHAVRLYELLLQYLNTSQKTRSFEVAELKYMLGLEAEYAAIKDFKRWVIDPAVKQLNERTDLRVSYENIKTGRTVTGLRFFIAAAPVESPKRAQKWPPITEEYIALRAKERRGETRDQVVRRILEERGQSTQKTASTAQKR